MDTEFTPRTMHIAVINSGGQPDYLYGLVGGLSSLDNLRIDVIDSDTTVGWFDKFPTVTHYNLRGRVDSERPLFIRGLAGLRYHLKLALYAVRSHAKVFHVQWEARPYLIERFILPIFYKLLGKRIVFTAHNVDAYAREGKRSFLHSWGLRFLYGVVDRIVVHTQKMKDQLCSQFLVPPQKVSVIRHGINNRVPKGGVSQRQARSVLQLDEGSKVLLFFGSIGPYKNVELLLKAFRNVVIEDLSYKLIVAGSPRKCPDYIERLRNFAVRNSLGGHCTLRFEFSPYEQVENYFMAADCLVLPYQAIYQSGVIFLAYHFGLPIIATDVGSFREDIVEGRTGFLSPSDKPEDLARIITRYFESNLYENLEETRQAISAYANERYPWAAIAEETARLYQYVTDKD